MNHNINEDNKSIWDTNAFDWDQFMGESGNEWHKELIAPETERLLHLQNGDKLLDIGCGNGLFARRMSKQGIKVTAFDFSNLNITHAKKYDCEGIDYRVLDACKQEDMNSLIKHKYQGIVSNMVFMDMPDLSCIFSNIRELLVDNGVFVFSIQHPCFNSAFAEVEQDETITLRDYIHQFTSKGIAIPTQQKQQYYFHRPISEYVRLGVENGLAVTAFVEPTFDTGVYAKFPPVLILRMEKQ